VRQEPGTAADQTFWHHELQRDVPSSEKIEVNGDGRHPSKPASDAEADDRGSQTPADIRWNFEKFLVGPRR